MGNSSSPVIYVSTEQIAKPSTVTLMFSNALKAIFARITLYPIVTLFIIILCNTTLSNSLHTCLCSKVQYQRGKVGFFQRYSSF